MKGDKTLEEKMKEINKLENQYGLVLFRMALTHLVDVGTRHLTIENVEESIAQIMSERDNDKIPGTIPVMTPEFKCEIIRCAYELAKFGIWELFAYIKEYVTTS